MSPTVPPISVMQVDGLRLGDDQIRFLISSVMRDHLDGRAEVVARRSRRMTLL
jgi:hypothetical protein